MQKAFCKLLDTKLSSIRVIFWDLDGTLGDAPGWSGQGSVTQYIHQSAALANMLKTISDKYGIYNVLVSRNGMFCDRDYEKTKAQFKELNFDDVLSCYRRREHSKVFEYENLDTILLVDDQLKECLDAQRDGAYAMHICDVFPQAVVTGNYALLYP